jgi:hypothetical protein
LGVSGDPPVNAFDRTLHDTLRDFLAVEAKRTDGPAKSDLFPLSRVVEFVGGWRQSEDAPVFRDFLRHPGYESSQVTSSEEPTHYEERRYRVRAAAKTALMAMGEPVPEGVVLEEKIVGTAK